MIARDLRTIFAVIFMVVLGALSNNLTGMGAEKWGALASIAAILAMLYIFIDIVVATETSLLYRISMRLPEPNVYRIGAVLGAIGCLVFLVLLIRDLVSP